MINLDTGLLGIYKVLFSSALNSKEIRRTIIPGLRMSGQKKISSFFASPTGGPKKNGTAGSKTGAAAKKRTSSDTTDPSSAGEDGTDRSQKRSRVDADGNNGSPAESLTDNTDSSSAENRTLSEEERSKSEESRLLAKMKLMATRTRGLVVKVHPSWYRVLETEFTKPYFSDLTNFIEEERKNHTVYPSADEVFSWTCMTPVNETKVVILGQDPYHGVNQAHGLCFSVKKGITPPPSLENMFKELSTDINNFVTPKHGCLNGWAEQGVLLLNAVLTVKAHNANSHKDRGWEKLTDAVVTHLNKNSHGIVFILWGSYAQKKGSQIDKKKHHVLQGPHPSPLSAHRGFFGCKHFSRCNELLEKEGKSPINWSLLP